MDKDKKNGMLLIVIGLCIPLVVLPFVSGLSKEKGFYDNLYKSAIELTRNTKGASGGSEGSGSKEMTWFARLIPERIPFRFFLIPTAIMLYMGIIRMDRARRRARGEFDSSETHEDDQEPPRPQ